jgi:hypothetical protein
MIFAMQVSIVCAYFGPTIDFFKSRYQRIVVTAFDFLLLRTDPPWDRVGRQTMDFIQVYSVSCTVELQCL